MSANTTNADPKYATIFYTMPDQGPPLIFGEWIKRRRKALDMTQDELAQRAGCSASALRKIETGERRPSKQLARLFAEALEIPVEDQPAFIRSARGELSSDRLQEPGFITQHSLSDLGGQKDTQPDLSLNRSSLPTIPPNRIPLSATPLIGRETEFAPLEKLINDPQCRLLTLTGIGGIGKTRLAIEIAEKMRPLFPEAFFIFH